MNNTEATPQDENMILNRGRDYIDRAKARLTVINAAKVNNGKPPLSRAGMDRCNIHVLYTAILSEDEFVLDSIGGDSAKFDITHRAIDEWIREHEVASKLEEVPKVEEEVELSVLGIANIVTKIKTIRVHLQDGSADAEICIYIKKNGKLHEIGVTVVDLDLNLIEQ